MKTGVVKVVSIFIPTTPNPTSGFFLMVPEHDLIPLDMSVEQALKMVISGGVVIPDLPPKELQEMEEQNVHNSIQQDFSATKTKEN